MIQRIQTVYLFLTLLSSVIFLFGKILLFSGGENELIGVSLSAVIDGGLANTQLTKLYVIVILAITATIGTSALIAIFLFKRRKLQIHFTSAVIFLAAGLIIILAFLVITIQEDLDISFIPRFNLVFPPLILIFSILALRAIRKDEELVRSYDRLR